MKQVSIILVLIALLALPALTLAVPVDPDAPDGVAAALRIEPSGTYILCVSGEIWRMNPVAGMGPWESVSDTLPIPVSEIQDWTHRAVIKAVDGTTWLWVLISEDSWGWEAVDSPCSPPIPNQTQSLGSLKQMFR